MINIGIKKRLLLLLVLTTIIISSTGCNQNGESVMVSNGPLTMEEKLEDFEYAYNIIKETILFLKSIKIKWS